MHDRATSAAPLARTEFTFARGAAYLAALGIAALLPVLVSPFFADDYFHIEHLGQLGEALTHGWVLRIDSAGAWWTPPGLSVEYFRPLIVLSFAADHLLYGEFAPGYHFTNLLMHYATALLLWQIARRVLGPGFAAWAAAALFVLHPAHIVAVGWISGRTDVLATMLYAGGFAAYLESRERPDTAPWLALACLSFGLALLSKEMAITLPAVVAGHALLFPRGETLARRAPGPVALGLVAVAYLALRVKVLGGFHAPPTPFAYHFGDPGLAVHLLTAPLLYLADLVVFVPPDPMATLPFWMAHPLLFAGLAAIVLVTFSGTMKKAGSRTLALWGLGWMGVTLLPVLMLTVGEHFLYLPSLGYCVLVASQLPASPAAIEAKARRSLSIVAALVGLVCFVRAGMFWFLSRRGAEAIEEAVAAVDRAPDAKHLLVIDVPASAALAFPHAVRLARPNRQLDVEMLSLVPRVMPDSDDLSSVRFDGPSRLELRRPSGYLGSYLERALEGPPRSFSPGDTIVRSAFTVTVLEGRKDPGGGAARVPGAGELDAFSVQLSDAAALVLARSPGSGDLEPISPAPAH